MSELRIVRGNSFKTRIKVHALNPDMTEMNDFSLLDCTNIELFVLRAYKAVRIRSWEIHSDDEIDITWDAPFCMNLGIYGLEIRGRLDGVAWRFANRDLFTTVETTQEGNIPEGSFIADGDYEMEADFVLVLRVGAVQSDWAVDDQSDPAYIKHKPDLDLYAQKTWIQQQGYITSETDPTVPAWAKQPHKPTYTAQEVGALPDTTVIPTALSQLSQDSTHRVVTDAQLSQIEFDHNKLDGTILDVVDIKAKIPAAASSSNQLADKAWVSANAGGSVIVDVDASNIEDNMKIIAGSEIYDAVIAGLNAGKTVYLRLTNNSDFPYILPMISRGQTNIIFSQFCYEATTRAAVVYVYSDSAVIFAYLLNLYEKPTTGIPKADLSANVQTSLGKADTAYQKPSGGIPKIDLASAVQTSLGKADTALQAETLFLNSAAYTINSADLANWNGKADKVPVVNHGTGSTTLAIAPNTFHVWGTVSALNITLTAPTDSNVVNLYSFQFTSGSTPTNLTLPSGVQWPKDNELTVEADTVYEINIRDNKATWSGWEVV